MLTFQRCFISETKEQEGNLFTVSVFISAANNFTFGTQEEPNHRFKSNFGKLIIKKYSTKYAWKQFLIFENVGEIHSLASSSSILHSFSIFIDNIFCVRQITLYMNTDVIRCINEVSIGKTLKQMPQIVKILF